MSGIRNKSYQITARGYLMLKKASLVIATLFLLLSCGVAQDGSFDVGLNFTGVFSKESSGNGVVQSPTQAGGFLATFRVKLASKHSLAFNYGRATNTQKYDASPFSYGIQSKVTEISAAYVFSPGKWGKWEPFALGGVGLLSFGPTLNTTINSVSTLFNTRRQIKPAFLYGAGVDYRLLGRLSLRLQYRGIFYSAPDFDVPGIFTGAKGHLAEPSVGIVFRF